MTCTRKNIQLEDQWQCEKLPASYLVQHRLGDVIVENLRRGVAVAIFGADVRSHHDQNAGTVRVTEVACLLGWFQARGAADGEDTVKSKPWVVIDYSFTDKYSNLYTGRVWGKIFLGKQTHPHPEAIFSYYCCSALHLYRNTTNTHKV